VNNDEYEAAMNWEPNDALVNELIEDISMELSFERWRAALAPGYRFDYREGRLCVTVEVEQIQRGEFVELQLRVVDDKYSRAQPPRTGDTFHVSYRGRPDYIWQFYAEGYFAHEAERRSGMQ